MSLSISRRDARRDALAGLIDYAGLFPPASLDLTAAVAEYRSAREGEHSWLVDRFICPAARLEELAAVMTATMAPGEAPWRLVVTADGSAIPSEASRVEAFDAEMGPAGGVDTVETRLPDPSDESAAEEALAALGKPIFFEVAWDVEVAETLDALDRVRARKGRHLGAKIRCGGLEAEAFPPTAVLADFIVGCTVRDLPFKATAGLHHPFRHTDESTGFTHHGFLNVLVASAVAAAGSDADVVEQVLDDRDPGAFTIGPAGVGHRSQRVGAAGLSEMRSGGFVGYGSCSFEEPVADLVEMGVLPA